MSRKDRSRAARAERVRALLEGGDHAGAAAEAGALLLDPAATEPERAAARAALEGLAPDRGAVAAGALGLAAAVAIAIWTVAAG
jgi:hypothetical protein